MLVGTRHAVPPGDHWVRAVRKTEKKKQRVLTGLMLAGAGVILALSGRAFETLMGGGFAALGIGWLVTSFRSADRSKAQLIRYAGIALFVLALVLFFLSFVARGRV
jgi:hypothetical protein